MTRKDRPEGRRLAGLGFEMAGGVAGFALFGYWIGGYYGKAELGVVIGAVLGITGSTYNLIRAAILASKKSSAGERPPDEPEP